MTQKLKVSIAQRTDLDIRQDFFRAFSGHTLVPWFENNIPEIFNGTAVCSGTLSRAVEADFNAPAHNALNDVRSIRAALHYLHFTRGYPNALYDV